jgi:hypothetical protein
MPNEWDKQLKVNINLLSRWRVGSERMSRLISGYSQHGLDGVYVRG